jgi:hypothetical protein
VAVGGAASERDHRGRPMAGESVGWVMRLLVPDAMPISLLPEPENARLDLSFDLIPVLYGRGQLDDVDAWRALRHYEPEPDCFCYAD